MVDFQIPWLAREWIILSKEEGRLAGTLKPAYTNNCLGKVCPEKLSGPGTPLPPSSLALALSPGKSWVLHLLFHPQRPCWTQTRKPGSATCLPREQTPENRCVSWLHQGGEGTGKTHFWRWVKAWENPNPPCGQTVRWLRQRDLILGEDPLRDTANHLAINPNIFLPGYFWGKKGCWWLHLDKNGTYLLCYL